MKSFPIYIFLVAGILVLGSCSKNKKEAKGLVEKKGILYKIGSNEPFTGTEKAVEKNRMIEYHVVNGKKNGIFKISYLNGTPEMIGEMKDNKNEGLWKYYFPDGTLESSGYFKHDLPEGKWFWYFPTGGLKEEGSYIKGISEGEWTTYDSTGKVDSKTIYKNGKKMGKIIKKVNG